MKHNSLSNIFLAISLFLVFLKPAVAESGDIKYRLASDMNWPRLVNVDQPINQNESLAVESVEVGQEMANLKEISKPRYVVGGLVATLPLAGTLLFNHLENGELERIGIYSTVLSSGLGHAIQGRWKGKGQLFTFGQLAAFAAMRIDANLCFERKSNERENEESNDLSGLFTPIFDFIDCLGSPVMALSLTTFVVLKFWEIIDIWFPSKNKYTVGSKDTKKVNFAILPFKDKTNGSGLQLTFSLSY